jgi:hypothetical protein
MAAARLVSDLPPRFAGIAQVTTASPAIQRSQIEQMVRQVLRQQLGRPDGQLHRPSQHNGGPNPLVVNVSARHVHVTQEHLEVLFGKGSKLTKLKDLYQEGEFASEQQVNVIGPRNRMIPGIRILGPCPQAPAAHQRQPRGHPRLRAGGARRGR